MELQSSEDLINVDDKMSKCKDIVNIL